jgi:hypothetical protein
MAAFRQRIPQPEEAVSKDEASWFETAQERLLTMRSDEDSSFRHCERSEAIQKITTRLDGLLRRLSSHA